MVSAILQDDNLELFDSGPVPWDNTELFDHFFQSKFGEFLEVAKTNNAEWAVIWTAGKTKVSSEIVETQQELYMFERALKALLFQNLKITQTRKVSPRRDETFRVWE